LPYLLVKVAREHKIRFTLGSDAKNLDQMRFIRLAASVARRGWLERSDVLNSFSFDQFIRSLKR
ncbi:MAG: DNA polymerase III, partial [Nanoarchaeota archaeon]|nr:DNA polymerase III [Nanoarchaeota archaeon]